MRAKLRIITAICSVLLPAFALSAKAETIRLGGSGTVLGLINALAGPFSSHSPGDTLEVIPGLGTSGALSATKQGALDIAFTGRTLDAQELASGLRVLPFLETPFVFVSATPEPLQLSCDQVSRIYSGEAFRYPTGETARLILRPRNDTSTKHLIASIEGMGPAMDKARQRHDIPVAPNDQDNMEAARRIPGAFAGMTLTQLSMEPNSLKHVILDGVEPTLEAMRNEAYQLKQKMFLVHKGELTPAGKRFFAFLATDEAADLIGKAGAVPLR
jgi:phosphate transport system substrate-binding protein